MYSSLEKEFCFSERYIYNIYTYTIIYIISAMLFMLIIRADSKFNKDIFDEIKSELAELEYEAHLVHRKLHMLCFSAVQH